MSKTSAEYAKEWKSKNPEKYKANAKRYYEKHKKEIIFKNKLYTQKNKDHIIKRNKEYMKKYRLINKEKIKNSNNLWRLNNRVNYLKDKLTYQKNYVKLNYSSIKQKSKDRYNKNKVKVLNNNKMWRLKNKDKMNSYKLKWSLKNRNNFNYKLRQKISASIRRVLKDNKQKIGYLDFDYNQLKNHLESKFSSKMSWGNYGSYWQIDHIIPLSWFKTQEQLIKYGWALKNLQPLETKLNMSKSNSFVAHRKQLVNDKVILL